MGKQTYGEAKGFAVARVKESLQAERAGRGYIQQKAISHGRSGRSRPPRPSGKAPPMIKETRYGGQREISGLGYGVATEYAQEEKQLAEQNFFGHQERDFFGEKKEHDFFSTGTKKEYDLGLNNGNNGKKKKVRYY
jgi:hypothetical protein